MKTAFFILSAILVCSAAYADEEEQQPNLAQTIHEMRMKEQQEEQVVRVIQPPQQQVQSKTCSSIQMTRQRLRDTGKQAHNPQVDKFNVNLGNQGTSITDNKGTVNNNINMQVVGGQNEDRCL